jgi:hypothetical protein
MACDPEVNELRLSYSLTFHCHVQHSFDTAAECEKAREAFAVDQRKLVQQAAMPAGAKAQKGLCIGTDDPRLNPHD